MKRRRIWVRRLSAVFALPVLIVALILAEEALRGWWELRSEYAKLRKAGARLHAADLVEIRTTPSDAATRLLVAAETIKKQSKDSLSLRDAPKMMKLSSAGKALVCFQQPAPLFADYLSSKDKVQPGWDELGERSEALRPLILQVRTALEEPVEFAIDYGRGPLAKTPDIGGMLAVLPVLLTDSLYQLHANHLQEASSNIEALLRLSRLLGNIRSPVMCTMSVSFYHFTMPLVWEALQARGWEDRELEAMQQPLEQNNCLESAMLALEMERANVAGVFATAKSSHLARLAIMRSENLDLPSLFINENYEPPEPNELILWLRSRSWQFVWSRMDEATALRKLTHRIAEVRALLNSHDWKKNPLYLARTSGSANSLNRWRMLLSGVLADRQTAAGLVKATVKVEVQRSLFTTGIALKRYQLRNGHHPDHLADLVPNFLKQEPFDWMNGEPLHYRRGADDSFSLYSVGDDGVDNGGDLAASDPSKKGVPSIDHGKDMVFPVAMPE